MTDQVTLPIPVEERYPGYVQLICAVEILLDHFPDVPVEQKRGIFRFILEELDREELRDGDNR